MKCEMDNKVDFPLPGSYIYLEYRLNDLQSQVLADW